MIHYNYALNHKITRACLTTKDEKNEKNDKMKDESETGENI